MQVTSFTDLPLLAHQIIYENLDIRSRIKLCMAIPKQHSSLYQSLVKLNEPSYDRKLRWLLFLVQNRNIEDVSMLPYMWRAFILKNRLDPTITDIFGKPCELTKNNDCTLLYQHIMHNCVLVDFQYNISDIMFIFSQLAKYANPNTFDILLHNRSTRDVILGKLANDRNMCKLLLERIMVMGNLRLGKHIFIKYNDEEWVEYMMDILQHSAPCYCHNKACFDFLEEILPFGLTSCQKVEIFNTALDNMFLDITDHMLSIQKHTRHQ